jgi:two-component system, NtrC family, sensor kinase
MPRLIWKKTESASEDVAFDLADEPQVVGRDPKCPVFIDHPLLSREHARLETRDGVRFVVDLDSTNFTKVNGERVTEKALASGDQIHFSRALCVYEA